jgi:Ala-tRNA(Pro) deacylase
MIPQRIVAYLDEKGADYQRRPHQRATTAQQLARAAHVPGQRVAKTVLVSVDGTPWMAVLPADESVRTDQLAEILGAHQVWLMSEFEFASMFPDCEVGAEPPFGALYGLPTVVDERLAREPRILVRAGSHDEALEMSNTAYLGLEHPRIAEFGVARYSEWMAYP